MLLLVALVVAAGGSGVDVDVKHARGLRQSYVVRDGVLFIAKDGEAQVEFTHAGHDVAAVFADEDEFFVVVDDKGGLHHFESGVYDSLWGLPTLPFTRAPLSLPFDVKHLRPGRLTYSMRHQNVLFYEDTKQQQFFWGNAGTTTLWALSDDGRELLLGDPWLPPDFSRELCGPARSSIVLASVAASASTVFVVSVDGRFFTRFVDYDSFGGTPFYDYSYAPFDSEGLKGNDVDSETQRRALPAEDWTQEPAPPSSKLSRRIAIRQDGTGNDARTLFVVGDNDAGVRGVFHKRLKDPSWEFSPEDVALGADEFIDAGASADVDAPAVAYSGFVEGAAGVFGEVDDFWFHCSPFHLTLNVAGEPVELIVHTVDAWTMFTNNNPRHDDTAMKSLKATLQLAPQQTLSTSTKARLDALFRGRLDVPFAFAVVANQHELVLFPVGYPWNTARAEWKLVMRSDPHQRSRAVVALRPASNLVGDVVAKCDPTKAKAALAAVTAAQKKASSELALAQALEAALPLGTGVADVLTVLTTTRFTWRTTRWLTGLEQHLPSVLAAQVVSRQRFLESSAADFAAVTADLQRCIGSE